MANFKPDSTIMIGNVPFDNSYKHVMTFADAGSQAAYFASVCDSALRPATEEEPNGYTYVRMNNSIRVPFNAERLYTKNYVMYKNANYGNKWFYAFIVAVKYVNENVTELVLELDVMQTWYFDYTLEECFVEREHVNDDTIGAHTNPEPEMPFNMVSKGRYTDGSLSDCWVVVQTNAIPHFSGNTNPDGITPVSGGWYNRVYSGCKYYAYDKTGAGDEEPLSVFLKNLNLGGGAESISNIFMFPKKLSPPRGGDYGLASDTDPLSYTYQTSRPTSLDGGYVPRNNKLFTYPYCFCRVDDNNGHSAEYRYEYWDGYELSVQSSLDPDATCIVAPQHYNGIDNNVTEAFTFPLTAKCSWVYSAYQTWSAQNQLANLLNVSSSVAMMAFPAARGIGAAAKTLGMGVKGAGLASKSTALSTQLAGGAARSSAASGGIIDTAMMAMGASNLANFAGEVYRMQHTPDVQKGSASGNTLFANTYMTYNVAQMVVRKEYAEIIDGFFDMYGYQVDRVKVPNRTGRPSWNYVKTQNACHRGNVPAQDMAQINSIYDSGVTFWHTADVGNYSLANK